MTVRLFPCGHLSNRSWILDLGSWILGLGSWIFEPKLTVETAGRRKGKQITRSNTSTAFFVEGVSVDYTWYDVEEAENVTVLLL